MGLWQSSLETVGMNEDFWRAKRVLITGHTGFKGAWLCHWLAMLDADLAGYALAAPVEPNLYVQSDVAASGIRSVVGDIRDRQSLKSLIEDFRPEIVFHMAAQSLVRPSYEDPLETLTTNIIGTAVLLDVVRLSGLSCTVINVTSDKCYENREWCWPYRENDPMGGHDPYSASKGCAEIVASSFRHSFFSDGTVKLASVRAGNVLGGGDWSEARLIPDIVRAHCDGTAMVIRAPDAIRPWQLVLEPLSGYMLLAERLHMGEHNLAEGWNFGPSLESVRPVRWVIERFRELLGAGFELSLADNPPHEAQLLQLDCSKARHELQWEPKLGISECLEWTSDWYSAFLRGEDMKVLTRQQISEYCRLSA